MPPIARYRLMHPFYPSHGHRRAHTCPRRLFAHAARGVNAPGLEVKSSASLNPIKRHLPGGPAISGAREQTAPMAAQTGRRVHGPRAVCLVMTPRAASVDARGMILAEAGLTVGRAQVACMGLGGS